MDDQADRSVERGYVDAEGLRTYYEAVGTGDPLLLLHGGFSTIDTFAGLTPLLAAGNRVYLPERRAHGRTPDIPGPITYGAMAEDTIAFLEAVGLDRVDVVGWSDGALVGLLLAMQRPDLVRRLVMIGQPSNLEGLPPESAALLTMERMPDWMLPPELKERYDALSPDGPQHLPAVVDKMWTLFRTEPLIPLSDLATVSAPVLLIVAEHDEVITIDYAHAMQQAFPNARLEIVPNATHTLPLDQPDIVAGLIRDFLASTDT
jgi:pimeloyl-ACP methyl ester carboxylesterase